MFTAIYVRVSTSSQNEEGQRREIQKWLNANSITNVRWFIDIDSGDHLERPQFEKLQKLIFDGVVDSVVVYKLDRLSRKLRDGINTLCEWCEKGVRVVSTSQQIDFNGTVGKMIASILFAIAEIEQETRRERQAAGIAVAKERGVYKGRQKGQRNPRVDISKVKSLREKGRTHKEISKLMDVSISSVRRYLAVA